MDRAQLLLLKAELANDPLSRGYSAMSNEQIVASLNEKNRNHNVESLSGQEMFYNTVTSEYGSLTDSKKNEWLGFCGLGEVDPFNNVVVAFVVYIFGGGSETVAALSAARVELISRAEEGGLPFVTVEDVEKAKSNIDL